MRRKLLSALVPFVLASGCSKPKEIPVEPLRNEKAQTKPSLEAKLRLDDVHCYKHSIPFEYRALLDTISWAEGADYNTLYGQETFADLSHHPHRKVTKGRYTSTAAGRYQINYSTAQMLQEKGLLSTMEPDEQDQAAIFLFERRGVNQKSLQDAIFSTGNFQTIWNKLALEWASFPQTHHRKGRYGQAHYTSHDLEAKFFEFYARERSEPCKKNIY